MPASTTSDSGSPTSPTWTSRRRSAAPRAASITTETAALEEIGRIWADSGCVDPSDRYYVFFESQGADADRAERAVVLGLIEFLGLEREDAPSDAAEGEIWVRADPRLRAAITRWS